MFARVCFEHALRVTQQRKHQPARAPCTTDETTVVVHGLTDARHRHGNGRADRGHITRLGQCVRDDFGQTIVRRRRIGNRVFKLSERGDRRAGFGGQRLPVGDDAKSTRGYLFEIAHCPGLPMQFTTQSITAVLRSQSNPLAKM